MNTCCTPRQVLFCICFVLTKWEQAGSLAEAALSLNHVFEDAQAAADQYLASLKAEEADARAKADELTAQAQRDADKLLADARREADDIVSRANREADRQWELFRRQVRRAPRAETGVRFLRKNAICTKAGCTRLAKRVQ